MLALTIKHPWAFAIAHWGKRIENRTWKPPKSLIGKRFAIHGGKVPTSRSELEGVRRQFNSLVEEFGLPKYRINGDITLRDVMTPGIVCTAILDGWTSHTVDPWFDGSGYGWILSNVTVIAEPIPIKGAQGLWNVPQKYLSQLL